MQLPCPICGSRDAHEFSYLGDATVKRPNPDSKTAARDFYEYTYLRDNPAGWHEELWYHEAGCRAWLIVERHTVTHEVRGARLASLEPSTTGQKPARSEAQS